VKIIYLGADVGFKAATHVIGGRAALVHPPEVPSEVARELETAHALLDASMKVPISDEMIRNAPELRVISCATTGSDHIARDELGSRGIPVRTLREDSELLQNITPAAELSWALLLACARKLAPAVEHVRAGHWQRDRFPGVMLHGKRLGLVGCGRIGSWMSRYALAFGMEVVGHDSQAESLPQGLVRVPLEALFAISDFVSVHVPLSDETERLIDRRLLEMAKEGMIFVNTSRGRVADESALLHALESGRVAAAGLDVLDGEPNVGDHPLVAYARSHDNLLITPHCGGFSPDAVRLVCARAAAKIISHLRLED